MSEIRHEKKVKVDLEVPLTNVGRHAGGAFDGQKNQTVFHGSVEVTPEVAEDLKRREQEHKDYKYRLVQNEGRQVDLTNGSFVRSQ